MKVYPGDKVKIEAYAKYYNPTGTASNITGFALGLTGAFDVTSGSTGEALKAYNTLNNYGGIIAGGGSGGSSERPKLFVNILLFDKDYNFLDAAWEQIDGGEQIGVTPTDHDYMSKEVTVKEAGFAYVFVSNENPTLVEFYVDDVVVTHTPTNVIQYNEYYPFGLQTSSSWTRENTKDNNYLYNAANELNKTSGWYEMYYRGYDPAIGRMLQVDPYAPMYASQTTYNYAVNNPVMMNDPNGGQATASHTYGITAMGMNRYDAIQRMGEAGDYFGNWSQSYFSRSGGNLSLPDGPYWGFWAGIMSKMRNGGFNYNDKGEATLSRDFYGNWTHLVPYNYVKKASREDVAMGANLMNIVASYRRMPIRGQTSRQDEPNIYSEISNSYNEIITDVTLADGLRVSSFNMIGYYSVWKDENGKYFFTASAAGSTSIKNEADVTFKGSASLMVNGKQVAQVPFIYKDGYNIAFPKGFSNLGGLSMQLPTSGTVVINLKFSYSISFGSAGLRHSSPMEVPIHIRTIGLPRRR